MRARGCGTLREVPSEVLQAFRYLCVRVALDSGTLQEISGNENLGDGQLVCEDGRTGKLYGVSRPSGWTGADEERQVARMRRLLLETLPSASSR